jgi:hypothetical protein
MFRTLDQNWIFEAERRLQIASQLQTSANRPHDRPRNKPHGEANSNRDTNLLETHATHRKQKKEGGSNRDKNALFFAASACPTGHIPVPANRHLFRRSFAAIVHRRGKSANRHLRFLFRLKRTSTVCFVEVTGNLNEPLFRLNSSIGAVRRPRQRGNAGPKCRFFPAVRMTASAGGMNDGGKLADWRARLTT